MENKIPEPEETWIHANGISYKVLFLTNDGTNPDYPVSVVYEGRNGLRWVRALSDWHRSFSLPNVEVKRG